MSKIYMISSLQIISPDLRFFIHILDSNTFLKSWKCKLVKRDWAQRFPKELLHIFEIYQAKVHQRYRIIFPRIWPLVIYSLKSENRVFAFFQNGGEKNINGFLENCLCFSVFVCSPEMFTGYLLIRLQICSFISFPHRKKNTKCCKGSQNKQYQGKKVRYLW